MPLLQVRDFPGEIYEQITLEAKRQNITIAQQTIVSNRKIPKAAKTLDHVKLIRENRDR